jgi:adenylosuccinate synthase
VIEDGILNGSLSSGESIGTTGRGIGPCYRDKVGRSLAIRLGDLYRSDFRSTFNHIIEVKRRFLEASQPAGSNVIELDGDKIFDQYQGYAERLRDYVGETTNYLLDSVESGKPVLFEGAQVALLDIDHGTFPFVTSSNSSGVGVSSGSGVPGRWITRTIGVLKAYSTRVGGGPLPTEQDNNVGKHLQQRGNEFGTVTQRPRRCGWFDAVATRYSARLSGADELAVMLLDVLAELDEVKICTGYRINGTVVDQFPSQIDDLQNAEPIYEILPGWQEDLTGARNESDLPANAIGYIDRIGELLGRPVTIISVGPDREQTIFRTDRTKPAPCPPNTQQERATV